MADQREGERARGREGERTAAGAENGGLVVKGKPENPPQLEWPVLTMNTVSGPIKPFLSHRK